MMATHRLIATVLVLVIAATGSALAEKPSGDNNGKYKQQEKHEGKAFKESGHSNAHKDVAMSGHTYFSTQSRDIIHQYYADQLRSGKCPPGLAKKNNGCMPPGQAKKWQVGHPLPHDVTYYDLPHSVIVELGTPPAGHRFVRVASDILMIAAGTGLVVDAIEDLSNLN